MILLCSKYDDTLQHLNKLRLRRPRVDPRVDGSRDQLQRRSVIAHLHPPDQTEETLRTTTVAV